MHNLHSEAFKMDAIVNNDIGKIGYDSSNKEEENKKK